MNYKEANNHWRTRSLFADVGSEVKSTLEPPYTLSVRMPGKVCFKDAFVFLEDPTGVKLANKYLDGYQHLEHLLETIWFRTEMEKWKKELFAVLAAKALDKIQQEAQGEGATALAAAKYLHSLNPTEAKPKASKKAAATDPEDDQDLKRMSTALKLVVNKNGPRPKV